MVKHIVLYTLKEGVDKDAAVALIAGLAVFPAVYIVKLFGLMEVKEE